MTDCQPGDAAAGSSGPRILATTGSLLLSPLAWTFGVVAEAGYDGVELMIGHLQESRDPARVLALAGAAGLDVPVVHGPYLLLTRGVLGRDYVDKTRRSLEIAAEVGAGTLVAHPPYRWEQRARRFVEQEVHGLATETGLRFSLENMFPVAGRAFSSAITPDELAEQPHVTFDTSHFAVAGVDLFDAWETLAGRVVHLHVSDNHGNGRDSHAPIGSGVLPIGAFLRRVGASGWSGTLTLELDCRAWLDSRETLVAFLTRERRKAEALLAGEDLEAGDERLREDAATSAPAGRASG